MQKKYKRRSSRYERIAALAFTAAIIIALPLITSFRSHNDEGKGKDNKPIDIVSPGSAVGSAAVEISSTKSEIAESENIGGIAPITKSLGEFTLTAYCPCVKCCGEWSAEHPSRIGTDYIQKTASGTIPKAGRTIGVDPDIIPFGTVVIINDHEYVAEDHGGEFGEECHGCYVMTVSSKKPPVIVNADKTPITDPQEFYSGCYGRAIINFYVYDTQGNKGVSAGLNGVMKLYDGKPLG